MIKYLAGCLLGGLFTYGVYMFAQQPMRQNITTVLYCTANKHIDRLTQTCQCGTCEITDYHCS